MKQSTELDRSDLAGLERIAEGRASAVPAPITERLLALGLVQQSENPDGSAMRLQLTTAGLALIRSSDQ